MIKKTFTYTDYNGNERTEDHFFHLNKAELMKMEMSETGGLVEMVQRIVKAQDTPAIIRVFEDMILKSYGQKSPDGREFVKNDELRRSFAQTEAYSDLFMELATNSDKAAEFVNGIMPNDIQKSLPKNEQK